METVQQSADTNALLLISLVAILVIAAVITWKRKGQSVSHAQAIPVVATQPQTTAAAPTGATATTTTNWGRNAVQSAFLGSYPLESFLKWFIRIAGFGAFMLAILIVTGVIPMSLFPDPTATQWIQLFGFVGLLAFFLPKGKGKYTAFALLGLLSLAFIGIEAKEGLDRRGNDFGQGFNHGTWPEFKPQQPTGPVMVTARASGEVIAPIGTYSVWLKIPRDRCLHWWAENPSLDAAMVKTRFMDWDNDVWSGSNPGKYVQARSWQSEIDRPVRITYQTVSRRKDGSCPRF